MSDEEKKDNSAPWINYRTDNAQRELEKQKQAVNEDVKKAKVRELGGIGDESSGSVKNLAEMKKEAEAQKGKTAVEKFANKKPADTRLIGVDEVKPVKVEKNIHLKSTTALTDPETAKQNLKDASKAQNFGKETLPSRGGGFRGGSGGRGGGFPMGKEPDEMMQEKDKDVINPKDILSKEKGDKTFEIALNQSPAKTSETPKKKSSFMASLDAQIDKAIQNKEKSQDQKSKPEPEKQKGKGILAEIEKKVEAAEKSGVKKSEQKRPDKEVTKQTQIKPTKNGK